MVVCKIKKRVRRLLFVTVYCCLRSEGMYKYGEVHVGTRDLDLGWRVHGTFDFRHMALAVPMGQV